MQKRFIMSIAIHMSSNGWFVVGWIIGLYLLWHFIWFVAPRYKSWEQMNKDVTKWRDIN